MNVGPFPSSVVFLLFCEIHIRDISREHPTLTIRGTSHGIVGGQ